MIKRLNLLLFLSLLVGCARTQDTTQQRLRCLQRSLLSTNMELREFAIEDLKEMGVKAAPAANTLTIALRDARSTVKLRELILEALAEQGPLAASPSIVSDIVTAVALDNSLELKAKEILGAMGEKAQAVLIEILLNKKRKWQLRRQAAALIHIKDFNEPESIDADSQESIQALFSALNDSHPLVRQKAAQSLGRAKVKEAAPLLASVLLNSQHANWDSVWVAAQSLKELGQEDWLKDILHKAPLLGSLAAANSVEEIPETAKGVFSIWQGALKDERWKIKRAAAIAIGKAIKKWPDLVSKELSKNLEELLFDENTEVQQAVEKALLHVNIRDKELKDKK